MLTVGDAVEELQSEKVLERVAALEQQNAEQALEIGRLRHLESRRADRTKASALLAIWRGGIQPSFDAWARLVEEVRAQRREAARRALRPGLLRCFVRWKQQTAVEMNGAFMKGLVLQMMPSLRKYEVQRCLQLWIAGVERIHHQASVEQRGLELLLLAYLQRWSVRVKALLSAPATDGRRGEAEGTLSRRHGALSEGQRSLRCESQPSGNGTDQNAPARGPRNRTRAVRECEADVSLHRGPSRPDGIRI